MLYKPAGACPRSWTAAVCVQEPVFDRGQAAVSVQEPVHDRGRTAVSVQELVLYRGRPAAGVQEAVHDRGRNPKKEPEVKKECNSSVSR